MKTNEFYETFSEAQKAVKALGIKTSTEYHSRYREDSKLPFNPQRTYANEWPSKKGWHVFLGKAKKNYYLTVYEAQRAVSSLGITNTTEYRQRYKEDPRLPSTPNRYYLNQWSSKKGETFFLLTSRREKYQTFFEAKRAVELLGITSATEYQKRYKEDPRLPSSPRLHYSKEWPRGGEHLDFFGNPPRYIYKTLVEAQNATEILGITSSLEYYRRYKEDPRLPANPREYYANEWPQKESRPIFLGKKREEQYSNLAQAQAAVIALGITSYKEYYERRKEDPKLPCNPKKLYSKEWPSNNGWSSLFGKPALGFYPTFIEAQQATAQLSIMTMLEYNKRRKEDPRLPSNPNHFYSKDWPTENGGDIFFGRAIKNKYSTIADAKEAVINLGITSFSEYNTRYKEDPRLPANCKKYYFSDWGKLSSSENFFIPEKINTFYLLRHTLKVLGIKNSKHYRELRKSYNQLPSNPKRSFPDAFVDWYHLCNIAKPYKFSKLQQLVKSNNITTMAMYKKWRSASNDSRIPASPHQNIFYKKYWVNSYMFFGIEQPFQPEYIHKPYLAWRDEIYEFMRYARGAGTKKNYLCKFVRLFVKNYQLGITPVDFVFNKTINLVKFREIIFQDRSPSHFYKAVIEFVDFIIKNNCAEEDPETGEIIRIQGAKNRLKGTFLQEENLNPKPSETVKPALSYQYVEGIRSWTIPPEAKTFSDLPHLQKFDGEWIKVPIDKIDKNDPDCVFKIIDSSYVNLWVPIYWLHAYTLFSVPLRGVQIAYNDSGEADTYIPEYMNNKIVWVKNQGKLAGLTKNQGMIKRYPNDEFGMFSTSNKTSINTGSQSVPWMPIDLAYWLIKLRKWQEKYNPIESPKAWLECERTNLNEVQRKQKGENCFLFRDFGQEECGNYGGRLAFRLAAALYYSQPEGVVLATNNRSLSSISRYKSEFTPHSMRVSLITIYIMEYNLDLSIIMKIAGHSSIIMSAYYVKTTGTALRKKIEEGEKRALKSQASTTQSMIEQLRIDEIKPNLIGNSEETLNALNNSTPAGNYLFRDWGLCPHAGTRCGDGGEFIGNTQVRSPVPTGYLGGENCIRCRHFITGPAFIGGLLAIFQEIILYLEAKQLHYDELIEDENELSIYLEKEDEKEYICNKNSENFDSTKRRDILANIRKTKSEYEVVAKKMDMLYCDLGAVSTLVHQCQALLNQSNLSIDNDGSNLQLIVRPEHELQVIAEEVSQYELLCEVCENAEIYQSASAELAITPRTQLIDNMMLRNNLKPLLFTLTNKQQLKAGNQLNKLFKERLKSHVKVNDLIEGKLLLSDLEEHERIEPVDLLNVLHQQRIDIKEV